MPLTMLMKTILRFYALLNIRKVIRSQFKRIETQYAQENYFKFKLLLTETMAGLAGVTAFEYNNQIQPIYLH